MNDRQWGEKQRLDATVAAEAGISRAQCATTGDQRAIMTALEAVRMEPEPCGDFRLPQPDPGFLSPYRAKHRDRHRWKYLADSRNTSRLMRRFILLPLEVQALGWYWFNTIGWGSQNILLNDRCLIGSPECRKPVNEQPAEAMLLNKPSTAAGI